MPPKNKAKAAGVSASSFLDLKAELSKHEEEFAKNKDAGKSTAIAIGGTGSKKISQWAKQNKGVGARAAKDVVELEAISRPTLESARAALERKAKIYDKLKKGKSGGLSDVQYDALLVDFDSKAQDTFESDSEDEDESLTVPKQLLEDDPIVEYEDEFGRMRTGRRSEIPSKLLPVTANPNDDPMIEYEDEFGRVRKARRSEIPREFLRQIERTSQDDDPSVIYNPVNHFPVFQPDAARVIAIQAELAAADKPLNVHYDAAREVRNKGAGFYQFSSDAEIRARQMEELKNSREETVRVRQDTGAIDALPGEVEGLRKVDDEFGAESTKSRAMEKRKREIEERKKMLDAKRRKVKGEDTANRSSSSEGVVPQADVNSTPAPIDPFAALEGQLAERKTAPSIKPTQADEFLAQLEREMNNTR